jgi:hypothetical protein
MLVNVSHSRDSVAYNRTSHSEGFPDNVKAIFQPEAVRREDTGCISPSPYTMLHNNTFLQHPDQDIGMIGNDPLTASVEKRLPFFDASGKPFPSSRRAREGKENSPRGRSASDTTVKARIDSTGKSKAYSLFVSSSHIAYLTSFLRLLVFKRSAPFARKTQPLAHYSRQKLPRYTSAI